MKTCRVCRDQKPLSEYYLNRGNPDGKDSYCKSCRKETNRKYYEIKPDKFREIRERYDVGGWAVYLLPNHNYVGITHNVEYRMIDHRYRGRHTDNVEVLHVFETEDVARAVEALYHEVGWEGASDSGHAIAGWIWITNGIENHKIPPTDPLPEGFRYGVTRSK